MNIYDFLILAAVAVLVYIAVRAATKKKKSGGCSGNCESCGGCSSVGNERIKK